MLCILHLIQQHIDDGRSLSYYIGTAVPGVRRDYWVDNTVLLKKTLSNEIVRRQNLVLFEINMYEPVRVQSQLML